MVVPDSAAAQKVPPVPGILEYRKDTKELYVRSNETWNVIVDEKKVHNDIHVRIPCVPGCTYRSVLRKPLDRKSVVEWGFFVRTIDCFVIAKIYAFLYAFV